MTESGVPTPNGIQSPPRQSPSPPRPRQQPPRELASVPPPHYSAMGLWWGGSPGQSPHSSPFSPASSRPSALALIAPALGELDAVLAGYLADSYLYYWHSSARSWQPCFRSSRRACSSRSERMLHVVCSPLWRWGFGSCRRCLCAFQRDSDEEWVCEV
jgi:hypothetical protein